MDKINILGINITTCGKEQILAKIKSFFSDNNQHQITTPNPEFIIEAHSNEEFFYILNKSDLAVPDGTGLVLAARLVGKKIERMPGSDLIYEICAMAEKEKKSIFLMGSGQNIAQIAEKKLLEKYPALKIVGAEEGLEYGKWELKAGRWIRGKEKNNELIERINKAQPDILFVGFGHPKQEIWIHHNIRKLPSVKVAMGVGGSFDFIAGKIRRAPKLMRNLGLEWLWRLILEPWRWKRIIDAVIIFIWKFFKWKYVLPFLYRSNVVCLLYKKSSDGYKILIVKRSDQPEHWQLPQGGTDHESIAEAGAREMREELGTDKFINIAAIKNLFRYEFDNDTGRFGVKKSEIWGYKGQKQSLFIAEFTGSDDDIKISFWDHSDWKWVESNNLINELHPIRRASGKMFLEKFMETIENNK